MSSLEHAEADLAAAKEAHQAAPDDPDAAAEKRAAAEALVVARQEARADRTAAPGSPAPDGIDAELFSGETEE